MLSGILCDGVDIHRCLAAQALGHVGASDAVPPLIDALLDEDEDVRTDAAEALATLADPRASRQLFDNLLGDPCMEVKVAAIEMLAKLQDRQVIPWLRRIVKGRDEEINWDEEGFFDSGWDDWHELQVKSISALATLNAVEAVPDIVAAIIDEDAQDMTEVAFAELARMGEPGIEALAGFLIEQSVRLRRRAAVALAVADDDGAAEPLLRALADPSVQVRSAALRARAALHPADIGLSSLLDDPDPVVRAEAVQLIGGYYPERISALLDDPSPAVQTAALAVLADHSPVAANDALVQTLRSMAASDTTEVSAAGVRALAAVVPQVAIEDLIPLLGDTQRHTSVRLSALWGLASIGGEQVVTALMSAMDDETRQIRLATMTALAHLAQADEVWPNTAGTALLLALRGAYDPEAAASAEDVPAATAGSQQDEDLNPAAATVAEAEDDAGVYPTSTLAAILEDEPEAGTNVGLPEKGIELTPSDMERLALAKQIIRKKRVAVAPKVVLHEDIRRFAARVLGEVGRDDVADELAAALTTDDVELRRAAADSLARIGGLLSSLPTRAAQALLAAVETADRDVKLLLIRALAASDDEAAGSVLRAHLSDPDSFVRAEAVRGLIRQGCTSEEMEPMLADCDPAVRLSAAQAVAAAGGSDAIGVLVNFAFSFEGYHGRGTARLLRNLDATRASALFVEVLRDHKRKREWSVAIQALSELNHSRLAQTAAVVVSEQQG